MRTLLKQHTGSAHARIDRAISGLCLANRENYLTFLRTHALAYRILRSGLAEYGWVSTLIEKVVTTLDADLTTLSADNIGPPMICDRRPLHPLGVGYVVCGSHFGKAVLRRRWERSENQEVRSAGRYLSSDLLARGWQRWIFEIDALTDPANEFAVLGTDADRTFDIFHECLLAVRQWERRRAAA